MELSKTAYVILGMLGLGEETGYDIKSLVDRSTRFFWAASYGQIYPELKKLEEAGLVASKDSPSGGRRRTTYSRTKAGDEAMRAWLRSEEPLHTELRHEGMLKLFFAGDGDRDDQLAIARAIAEKHERTMAELEAIRETLAPEGFTLAVLEGGIAYQQNFIDWAREVERRIAAGKV